jgi:hypothetical protein
LLTAIIFAGAILTSPRTQADKWDLSAGQAPKSSVKYDVAVKVNQAGQEHTAVMKMAIDRKDAEKDKPLKGEYNWTDIQLDGGQAVPDQDWPVTFDVHGGIAGSDSSEGADSVRKTLMPVTFIFPTQPVALGDTWTSTIKGGTEKADESMTFDMKADSVDKVGDVDALKVTEKISQKGDSPLTGTGTWWLDKSGKVLKFEVKVSNWVVAVSGPDPMDADFSGSLAK